MTLSLQSQHLTLRLCARFFCIFTLLQERIMTLSLESQHLIFQTLVGEVPLVCGGRHVCVCVCVCVVCV
jgi:hypothetical protein